MIKEKNKTIFLIVSERSGANLLLNMVAAHSELCAPLPPHFFRHLTINRARYGDLSVDDNWRALGEDITAFTENISEPWTGIFTPEELDQRVSSRSMEEALAVVVDEERCRNGAKYAVLKENEFFRFMPAILVAYPDSRFIWQVRDPRDMLTSFKRSTLFSKLIKDPVAIWELEQQQTLNVYPFLKEKGRIHFHRYEDLIQSPENVLGKLCEFIGVSFEESMLDFHKGEMARRRSATSDLRKNVAKPVMKDNSGKYRTELSNEEISDIENQVGELMQKLGYTCENPIPDKSVALRERQEVILEDESTSLEDRKMRAARIDAIADMLSRPFPSPES